MSSDAEGRWQDAARGILRAEIKRRGMTYGQVADRLREYGIEETDYNIGNKIARGTFSAAFFLSVLSAIGCEVLRIERP